MVQIDKPSIFQTDEKDKYIKTVFTTDSGLPQNSIASIVQTRDGYIWIATFGGLSRFDGIKFTNFIPTNTSGLVNNRLSCLYEDRNGVLWIGSEDGDLTTYQNGKFSLIKKNEGPPQDSAILSLLLDQNNILWIGGSTGLKTYDLDKKVFHNYKLEDYLKKIPAVTPDIISERNDLSQGIVRINNIREDANHTVWIASSAGVIKFQDNQFTNFSDSDALPYDIASSLQLDADGNLLLLTFGNFGKIENNSFSLYKDFKTRFGRRFFDYSTFAANSEKKLFFYSDQTIYEYANNELKELDISDTLKSKPRSGIIDKDGDLWIGTETELVLLKKRNIQTFYLSYKGVWRSVQAIIQTPDNAVWTGNLNDLMRWEKGKFEIVPLTPESGLSTKNNVFNTMAYDKEGFLWLGTWDGITKFKDNHFSKFNPEGLLKNSTASILFDRDGSMWIGNKVKGLQNYRDGVFTNYSVENGLVNNSISYLMQDSKGVLWIGTRGGLSRFENGTFTNYTTENGLTHNNVRDIYEDADGTLWIGTYGGGILRFRDGKFVAITSKDGLAEDIASRILVDDRDYFWILGNQGVYSVSRNILNDFADGKIKKVYCSAYGINDGMASAEGNGGNQYSGWKTTDGKLWFPMIRGGIIIDPTVKRSSPPPVYIENLILDEKQVEAKDLLQIQPGQNNLQITYTALNFSMPDQLQFRYKLLNYDDDWQEVGTRRTAYYTQLPPGKYTFMVLAISADGITSQKEAKFEIEVFAPIWKTKLFYLLCFLTVIAMIVLLYQRRLRLLKRRELRREEFSRKLINAHESERHRISSELHDGLGQELLIIKNWAHLCLMKTSEKSKIRGELNDILDSAGNALGEIRNITRNLRPQNLQRLGLTETLIHMIHQVKESSGIDFSADIENIDGLFSEDEELSVYRIVQESLNNIVKHSEATQAVVQIIQTQPQINMTNAQDSVEIMIIDNGKGFNVQNAQKTSFGLDNILQRVELLNGVFAIDSKIDNGTKLTLNLMIKPKKPTS